MARRREKKIDMSLSIDDVSWIVQSLKKEYYYYSNTYGNENEYTNRLHKILIKMSNEKTNYRIEAQRQRIKENRKPNIRIVK
tara:strand:+ start:156 stop:401 length:246 start_codon:yes stop_codon:yes gene_type:complete